MFLFVARLELANVFRLLPLLGRLLFAQRRFRRVVSTGIFECRALLDLDKIHRCPAYTRRRKTLFFEPIDSLELAELGKKVFASLKTDQPCRVRLVSSLRTGERVLSIGSDRIGSNRSIRAWPF